MFSYTVRDKTGIAKARISDSLASQIIDSLPGVKRDTYFMKNDQKVLVSVFEVMQDFACEDTDIALILLTGDLLVPIY